MDQQKHRNPRPPIEANLTSDLYVHGVTWLYAFMIIYAWKALGLFQPLLSDCFSETQRKKKAASSSSKLTSKTCNSPVVPQGLEFWLLTLREPGGEWPV